MTCRSMCRRCSVDVTCRDLVIMIAREVRHLARSPPTAGREIRLAGHPGAQATISGLLIASE